MKAKYVILVALLFLNCSYLSQKHRGMGDKVIKEKEERLFDAAMRLLEAPSDDPLIYRNARRTFEIALDRYLQATGWENDKVVHLEKRGITLLLPVQVIQSGDLAIHPNPALRDSVKVLWMPVGPLFKGEIVDLKWLPARNNQQAQILALFPDSLLSLSWSDNNLIPNSTLLFDSTMLRPICSAFPAGLFFSSAMSESQSGIPFITTHLTIAQMISLSDNRRKEIEADPEILSTDSNLGWSFVEGRDILKDQSNTEGIRSIRQLPGANMQVFLDQKGFLLLTPDTNLNSVWMSNRAWGNRIFMLDSTTIAVCDNRYRRFTVFQYSGGNELKLWGQSFSFEGNVTSLTAVGEEVLVNTVTHDNADMPWSQLHLIPGRNQLWKAPVESAEPKYPDYDGKLVFLPGETGSLIGADWPDGIPAVVWMNVYETLFQKGKNDILVPNLVRNIEHDSTFTRWRIQIKPGIFFADGATLTAGEVIASWQKSIEEVAKTNPNTLWLWQDIMGAVEFTQGLKKSIEGFQVLDKFNLQILLTRPIPNFPINLSSPIFGIKRPGSRWTEGTGPFKIVEIQSERSLFSITCDRNRYYNRGMPPLKSLVFAFEVGSPVDFLMDNRNAAANIRRIKDVAYFREIHTSRVIPSPDDITYFLALNPKSGSLSDTNLRRRIVSALNREVTAKMLNEAEAYPATYLVSRSATEIFGADSNSDYTENVHSLTIAYNAKDMVGRQIAERLATRLSELNIPHRVPVELSVNNFSRFRRNGNYDILVDSYIPLYPNDMYNLAQLCYRGYALEKEISGKLDDIFANRGNSAMEVEKMLIDRAILYPVVRTKSYVVLPAELRDTRIFGFGQIAFSQAWMPL